MSLEIKSPQSDMLGGDTLGDSSRSKLHDTIARYSNAKARADLHLDYIENLLAPGASGFCLDCLDFDAFALKRIRDNLSSCGNYLLFHWYYTANELRLRKARFCKIHLLCPFCAIRRACKATKAYWDRFQVLQASNSSLKPYLLTLTVKNGYDLSERYNHLHNSWKKFLASRRQTLKRCSGSSELAKCDGGVYSYEFTYKDLTGWHPHIHAVVLCSGDSRPDFPYEEILSDSQRLIAFQKGSTYWADLKKNSLLSQDWLRTTGDSFVCDFKPISGVDGFCEVFKYALKFSRLPVEKTFHAYSILKGCRLQGSFGNFRGVEIPDSYLDDPFGESEDYPYLELFYKYLLKVGYCLEI